MKEILCNCTYKHEKQNLRKLDIMQFITKTKVISFTCNINNN